MKISVNSRTPLDSFCYLFYSSLTVLFLNCSFLLPFFWAGFLLSEESEKSEESLYFSMGCPSELGSFAHASAFLELIQMYLFNSGSFQRASGEIQGNLWHNLTSSKKQSFSSLQTSPGFQNPSMDLKSSIYALTGRNLMESTFKNLKKVSKLCLELENGTLQYLLFVFLLQMIQLKMVFLVNTLVLLSSPKVESLRVLRRRFCILRVWKLLRLPQKSSCPNLSENMTLPSLSTSMTEYTFERLTLSKNILKSIQLTLLQVQDERMGSQSVLGLEMDEEELSSFFMLGRYSSSSDLSSSIYSLLIELFKWIPSFFSFRLALSSSQKYSSLTVGRVEMVALFVFFLQALPDLACLRQGLGLALVLSLSRLPI